MPASPLTIKGLHLAPSVHAVCVDADLVLLDLARDRYVCLADLGPSLDASRRSLDHLAPEVAETLRAEELAQDDTPRGPPWRPIEPPTFSAMGDDYDVPSWRDTKLVQSVLIDAVWGYRRRSLADLVAWSGSRPQPCPQGPPSADLLKQVRRFHAWTPFLPAPGKCLIRSFLLLRLLRQEGHDAQWVFGVRTWPFRAHCWLQHGEVALDDHLERLVAFHPILVA
jgi:hypothetical protein